MEQTEEIKKSPQMSPKLAFLFGLVCAVAIVSIIGFVVLLNKQEKGTSAGDTGNTTGGEQGVSVVEVAKAVGLDSKKFQSCVDNRTYKDKVQSEAADAGAAGGQGTPYSIIIGSKGETFTVSGALPYEFFKAVVDALLKGEDPSSAISSDLKDYLVAAPDIALKPASKDDHIRGSLDAKVKIIEYSDLQCPFCARHHPVMKQLESAYSPDDFAWIYRHFPLSSIHPNAQPLAEASECASEIGGNNGFWAFIDKVFGA
jgi:protein-disulfide isomerase